MQIFLWAKKQESKGPDLDQRPGGTPMPFLVPFPVPLTNKTSQRTWRVRLQVVVGVSRWF